MAEFLQRGRASAIPATKLIKGFKVMRYTRYKNKRFIQCSIHFFLKSFKKKINHYPDFSISVQRCPNNAKPF